MFIRKEKAMALINLPDFVTKKVDMLTAAKQFKAAIDKNCRRMGMDPDWETNILLDKEYQGDSNKVIVVSFEAGPYDWGVGYSLGSHPKSFNPMKNPNDWYLECYYGFDVMFTPLDFKNAKSYEKFSSRPAPSVGMQPNYDIREVTHAS